MSLKRKRTTYRTNTSAHISNTHKEYYKKKLADCSGDSKATWKILNSILHRRNSNNNNNNINNQIEFLYNDEILSDNISISEAFNNHFVEDSQNDPSNS